MALLPLLFATFALPPSMTPLLLPAYGLHIGWTSHLLFDWMFGKPKTTYGKRPAGIPLRPCSVHVGLLGAGNGLKSNGWTARLTAIVLLPLLMIALAAVGM